MTRNAADTKATGSRPPLIFTLRLDATDAAVREALAASERLLHDVLGASDACETAQIVLAEALNNVVEHAYEPGDPGNIDVEICLSQTQPQFVIRDRGRPMPDGPLPGERMPSIDPEDLTSLPEGGFGWAMLRQLTTGLSYKRDGQENVLRFEIASRSDAESN